jgi:hypothetical protein
VALAKKANDKIIHSKEIVDESTKTDKKTTWTAVFIPTIHFSILHHLLGLVPVDENGRRLLAVKGDG